MNADAEHQWLHQHLARIRGFLDQRMLEDAWRELEAVPLNARGNLSYRWLRISACLGLDKDLEAGKIAGQLCSEYPEQEDNWLFLANLLSQVGQAHLAVEVLTGAQKHTASPDIRYELAANLCAIGKIEEAREKLEALLAVHPLNRDKAKNDHRFEPVADIFLEDDE